jgi:hypothetical protein
LNTPAENQSEMIGKPKDVRYQGEKYRQYPVTRKTALENCQVYILKPVILQPIRYPIMIAWR